VALRTRVKCVTAIKTWQAGVNYCDFEFG